MKRKVICLLLSLIMCFGVMPSLTACKDDSLYVLLMANAAEDAFYKKHFAELEKKMNIKIKYASYASGHYYEALKTDRNTGNTPDVFYLRPSDMKKFISDGLITSIEGEVNEQMFDNIYESAVDNYRFDKTQNKIGSGDLYAIPKDLSVQQIGYNRTIVERNQQKIKDSGIKKMPWEMDFTQENYTFEDLKTMAALCADYSNSKNPIYGMDIPNIEILTWAFGGSLLSQDMQSVQTDSQAFKQAVQYQAELIKSGAADFSGAKHDIFLQGRVAFYGEVNSFDIKSYDSTFERLNQKWDIMPWPVVDNSTTEKALKWTGKISSAGYAVSSTAKNKANAIKVASSFLSRSTQETLVTTEKLALPFYKDIAEEAYILTDNDSVYSPKSRKFFIDVISERNGRFSDGYKCYNLLWQNAMTTYLERIWQSDPNNVMSQLKSDAEYTELKNTMQTAYNEIKNK